MTRAAYLTLFFVNAVVAALLREFGKYALARLISLLRIFAECDPYEDSGYCFGNQLVYRMSFSLTCFFMLTGLLSVALARGIENCCCLLCFQIPFYIAMLIASLFIPNSFFDGYADVARVASGAFIILQIVIIVDWAYNMRDLFLDKMESSERDEEARQALLESNYESLSEPTSEKISQWEAAYLFVVFVLSAATIGGVVMMLKKYSGCELNITFIALTILGTVMITALSVLAWVNVGLLPSVAVSCYLVFLCYQAVHSNPDETCSATDPSSVTHQEKSAAANAALAALTITWTSWRTSATQTNLLSLSPSSSGRSRITKDADSDEPLIVKDEAAVTEANENSVPEYQFHVLMVLSSLYMAMVITNWGSSNGLDSEDDQYTTMWVKIVSQWMAAAIFLWTLVAPSVFPDREFGIV